MIFYKFKIINFLSPLFHLSYYNDIIVALIFHKENNYCKKSNPVIYYLMRKIKLST